MHTLPCKKPLQRADIWKYVLPSHVQGKQLPSLGGHPVPRLAQKFRRCHAHSTLSQNASFHPPMVILNSHCCEPNTRQVLSSISCSCPVAQNKHSRIKPRVT